MYLSKMDAGFIWLICCLCFVYQSSAQQKYHLTSPDKDLKINIEVSDSIYYWVYAKEKLLLDRSTLSLQLNNEVLGIKPKIKKLKNSNGTEERTPVVPLKYSRINKDFKATQIDFKGSYSIEFKAYNEGFSYRFKLHKKDSVEVIHENFNISFPSEYTIHLQQTPSFKTSYEYPYTHLKSSGFTSEENMSVLPVLIEAANNHKILISESDLSNYPAMFIKGTGEGLKSVFPKNPIDFEDEGDRSMKILKRADYIAKIEGNRSLPWRYFVITDKDTEILENTMSLNLATTNVLKNVKWIKPGQVSWEWWNGASPYNVDFVAGFNEETYKYFIDFASAFDIPYIIMDEGWAASTTDPYTPNPDIDLFKLIEYGKERNVKIVLWLTWLTVEHHFDLFEKFAEWGIAGVKIDFMDRSDQWMVNFYERVAKEAAKYELFVDFHGSFKPAGLEYKYPNILSYEGVLGMEQMGRAIPDNSLFLPFMRNAVGAMDYTPGAMISMQPEYYYSRRPNSAGVGTRAYQMALFVIFESGLQMLADNPTNYFKNEECTQFITDVPVTWDETIALEAKLGEYAIVAKRKGERWFLGGIANSKEEERTFEIQLDFLKEGEVLQLTSFEDGINAKRQAMDYVKRTKTVKKGDILEITIVKNGGWAAKIE
ncbi:glycoside hydrolase family 97 protein [Zunongwangia pacifica]|uniref:Glycoside hydrolase family 97 protein n=1 Tax=Zunongwangia pacifica TaxID=2911062 RepID=A0A9X2A0B0_9FLAO|nr:glycoside hydrolase family 97 protein [Zunongwangia pacifica]MCL6217849.1 glycoside hydrolase family 97 protein [Zunongwangia pacifica]